MPLYGKVAGYRQPPTDPLVANSSSPRLSLTPSASGLSARSRGSGGEIWVDSQPNCDKDLVNAPLPAAQYDNSAIYGYMDEHKKAMIQQWVEGQARGGPSIPPSHLTGVDSLAWLQERAEEQAQGQYTALTQFKMASSSTSSCSSSPAVETQAVVEVERLDGDQMEHGEPPASKEPSPRRECELNLNLRSGVPPPPPLRGGRTEAEQPEDEECNSKASSGSRGSSRRSDVGTTTEGLGSTTTANPQSKPAFNTKLQDPYRAPRKVALPRASPEKIPGTRTLDELYQHCEQLVETLSQASEELKAKEGGSEEECLRITGIDEIEIYSVEEGSEGSVEVSFCFCVE